MSNLWGQYFRVMTFGESHGIAVGCTIDGCPPGYKVDLQKIQLELDKRKPGQSSLTSPRQEEDRVECLSGLENGVSLGTPLSFYVKNKDANPKEYKQTALRPGHADTTTLEKYGLLALSGGGRASARETLARVIAGSIACQILQQRYPQYLATAYVQTVGQIECQYPFDAQWCQKDAKKIENTPVRCPCHKHSTLMMEAIEKTKNDGDSLGGIIRCLVQGVPKGIGEPVFHKLQAVMAMAMMSIPATKGFEIGSGFSGTQLKGSEHNDPLGLDKNQNITPQSNNAGGVQGGISNGLPLDMRIAFKPTSTIQKPQQSVNRNGQSTICPPHKGRHDPCVLPRAVPIVEAMAHLTIIDLWLQQQTVINCRGSHNNFPQE